jgi:hypothetical protein
MNRLNRFSNAAVVAIMAILTGAMACGGDDDDDSGDIDSGGDGNIDAGGTGDAGGDGGVTGDLFSRGAMQVGSVIVNGVRYDDSAAEVSVDDAPGEVDDLGDGMVVEVHGHADDDGFVADTVEVENEIRGTIDVMGPLPEDFIVMAHRVVTDGQVVFVDVADVAGLSIGDRVEVHGMLAADGSIRATRVERDEVELGDEARGEVTGLTSLGFLLGDLAVDTASAEILPAGAILEDGASVEVHGDFAGDVLVASRIDLEDSEDGELSDGVHVGGEGYVSGFTETPGDFAIGDQAVRTTTATTYEGGLADELANDMRVEAEGDVEGGVLIADKISFHESARLEANVEAVTLTELTVLGRTVVISSLTDIDEEVVVDDGVRVRGFLNADGTTITATRIQVRNPIEPDRIILQGAASALDPTAGTLTVLGFPVDASSSEIEFHGHDEQTMSAGDFFAQIVLGRTVVKARGVFTDGTLVADQIELE